MAEVPAPDLRDDAGRLRRLALSLLIGIAAGAIGYFLANTLIAPEPHKAIVTSRQMSRDTFVIYVALIAGVSSFVIALAVQNRIAKKRWAAESFPQAKIR